MDLVEIKHKILTLINVLRLKKPFSQAKHESTIARLEQDYKELKQRHRYELDMAHDRLEASTSEIRDLKIQKLGIDEVMNFKKKRINIKNCFLHTKNCIYWIFFVKLPSSII